MVGAGYWGPNLIRNCADLGVLQGVCDADDKALGLVHATYPAAFTTRSYDELLGSDIDAVVVAAPAHLHAEFALRALDAGKHVFVEKPLALSVVDGERVARLADRKGLVAFVGHLLLYHPAVSKLRALVSAGEVGPVWHVRSRRLSLGKLRSHEDVWWSFAPHDVAVILALMGEEPTRATALFSARRDLRRADAAYVDFEFSQGRSAHVEVCWLDPEKSARLDVFGANGVITLKDSRGSSALTVRPFLVSGDSTDRPTVTRGEERNVAFEEQEPLRVELQAFLAAIVDGSPVETDAWQGVRVLRALTLAERGLEMRQDEREALA